MISFLIIVLLALLAVAVYFIWKEFKNKNQEKSDTQNQSSAILKNKKAIENMVANVESILTYADGNDILCNRLVEVKDTIRFFNPTTNQKVLLVDQKIANRLDDLKIMVAKDNTQETCFRVLEEIEAFLIQRKKEEQQ